MLRRPSAYSCGHNWTSHCVTAPLHPPLSWKPQPREQAGPSSRSTVVLFPFTKMVFVARVLSEDSILLGYTELKVGVGTGTET